METEAPNPGAGGAGSVAGPNPPDSAPSSPPASAAQSGNLPSIEAILQKRARGEKLTRAEAGKIGGAFRGGRKPVEPDVPKPSPRRLGVADGMAAEGQALVPPPPPVDADLCRATAEEILDTLNEAGQASIAGKCKTIQALPADAESFKELASLKPGARTTIVNTSPSWLPKLLRVVGLNPDNAPEAMAGVAALLWGLGYYRASSSLDKLAKEKLELERAAKAAAQARAATVEKISPP